MKYSSSRLYYRFIKEKKFINLPLPLNLVYCMTQFISFLQWTFFSNCSMILTDLVCNINWSRLQFFLFLQKLQNYNFQSRKFLLVKIFIHYLPFIYYLAIIKYKRKKQGKKQKQKSWSMGKILADMEESVMCKRYSLNSSTTNHSKYLRQPFKNFTVSIMAI